MSLLADHYRQHYSGMWPLAHPRLTSVEIQSLGLLTTDCRGTADWLLDALVTTVRPAAATTTAPAPLQSALMPVPTTPTVASPHGAAMLSYALLQLQNQLCRLTLPVVSRARATLSLGCS